ncbi:NADH-quinone oxidoreductase subunit M [Burkholderia multivorans]|uniref:complex I subunit 4 family protein n=1 Tax=Burkholderia multivorans TaxID=87883 RepID=UPI000CFE5753|nr:NADH-quinone oxidoreductase subunit M [Burkholderia multivorans]PRG70347.1 NADH-quinone oxidoreductase subunit M [Burkholderia multivorans]
MHDFPFLSLAIWAPILFGACLLRAGSDQHLQRTRLIALIGAIAGLAAVAPIVAGFDPHSAAMQFVENRNGLSAFGAGWRTGVDGASLWLVVLTAFTTLVVVVASWQAVTVRVAQYYASFLILSGLMIGVFVAQDGLLFFIFFEATLIPLYLLIGTWGREHRVYAAVKFFFISFAGSLLLMMAMLYLYAKSHTFDMAAWRTLQLGFAPQLLVFLGFFAAFAVKVPMWPVHTWLRDVYTDGPTGAALMLAMLKLGGYGFLRFALPITPDASHFFAPAVIALSLFAIVYASLLALAQTDFGKLLAYSTVAHMGVVTLGLFLFNRIGVEGAIVQLVSYGFVAGAMLLCASVLVDRTKQREMTAYGGVASAMPRFAMFAVLFAMANVGLPGTSGFVGEFMVIMGAIRVNFWIGAVAALTLIFSASYTLWMLKRVVWGRAPSASIAKLVDLSGREIAMFASLALIVLAVGIDPKPFTDAIDPTVGRLLADASRSKLPAGDDTAPAQPAYMAAAHD